MFCTGTNFNKLIQTLVGEESEKVIQDIHTTIFNVNTFFETL